ncbi:MAG: YicC family protein [Bacteroidia bacterium]|nr:YicC family protein [Bacteroidia bacterium]
MIHSMTGFGKVSRSFEGKIYALELRALNSKFLEMNLRLPSAYKEKELAMRSIISERIIRGKVDVFLSVEQSSESAGSAIDKNAVISYYGSLKEIADEHDISAENLLAVIMRLPNAVNTDTTEIKEEEWEMLKQMFTDAIDALIEFREQEGKVMKQDITERVEAIREFLKNTVIHEEDRIKKIRERIDKNLNSISDSINYDKNRFEQELVYYIEKIDFSEEKVRLNSHCDYLLETLKTDVPNGKKLSFIAQEIGREINTLGSKANDADIQRHVVGMKDELEKIKEQVLNIV